jgi:hypothetical protein
MLPGGSGAARLLEETIMTTLLGDGRFRYEVKGDWGSCPMAGR